MRLSCAVRAHPDRAELVAKLVPHLGDVPVVWDERNDSWDTGERAWRARDPQADWHLVIEDDAVVCRDLLTWLAKALETLPNRSVASLYAGNRTASREISNAVGKARSEGVSWVKSQKLVWGVAIAAPVTSIPGMLAWCATRGEPYDTRIAAYYEWQGWPAYYTVPSLVDHGDAPSLLGHSPGRRALWFIGEDASALDWDPAGDVLVARPRRKRMKEHQVSELLTPKTNTVLRRNGRRLVVRKGVTIAEAGADIVKAHPDLWEPLTVDYPAKARTVEQATAAPGEKRDIQLPAEPRSADVRAWAKEHDVDVPARGKLSDEVVERYKREA